MKKKLYIGCSLTQAPKDFIKQVAKLKDSLRKDYDVLDFVGLEAGSNKDVYDWDINNCVRNCDIFLAITDHPSVGLGWELAIANELGKPILAVAHKDASITRLLLGAVEACDNMNMFRYEDIDEVRSAVSKL